MASRTCPGPYVVDAGRWCFRQPSAPASFLTTKVGRQIEEHCGTSQQWQPRDVSGESVTHLRYCASMTTVKGLTAMANTHSSRHVDDLTDSVDRAASAKERVRIIRCGKEVAAVVPIEDLELLEELEDRLDLLEALDAIQEAKREGGIISWEQFESELGLS